MNNPVPHYRLRRSLRAKRARIVIKADGEVEVVAPPKAAEALIHQFVLQNQDWILRTQLRLQKHAEQHPNPLPSAYEDGVLLPYLGRQTPLKLLDTQRKTVRVVWKDDVFWVYLPSRIRASADCSASVRTALMTWMKRQARQQALQLIERYGRETGLLARSVTLKAMKSRWGSCGPQNDINLNWLLVLAPPSVLEYVVVHELCHIRHKNHSADFWQLVQRIMPDYQQQRSWLKLHGARLMQGL
jgi:predicted metal-dependent hydrolase